MESAENKVDSQKNCKENDIYDAECADVIDGFLFRLGKSSMEFVSDKARHAGDECAQTAQVGSDHKSPAVVSKSRQKERCGNVAYYL